METELKLNQLKDLEEKLGFCIEENRLLMLTNPHDSSLYRNKMQQNFYKNRLNIERKKIIDEQNEADKNAEHW